MKQLIVTADDVGLHRGMTAGAIRAHEQGIVTACSIVANGRAFDDAVARLRDLPSLEVGVHLALVEEQSLTGLALPKGYSSFAPRYALRSLPLAAIARELRAQVERVAATGLRITHLNGHQHLHLLPRIFDLVLELASEFAIPYVRIVDEAGGHGSFARRAAVGALSAFGRRARARATLARPDRTIGIVEAGHLTADRLLALFAHVDGTTELVTHPGLGVDSYDWGYAWEEETRALCDPRLRAALAAQGIARISPSALGAGCVSAAT